MNDKNNKSFTLIELIIVIAILGVLTAIALPNIFSFVEQSKIVADKATLKTLNTTTTIYGTSENISGDIFSGCSSDHERMEKLVYNGLLNSIVEPQSKNSEFVWITEHQIWTLFNDGTSLPLSPLGSSFDEISSSMIDLIKQIFVDTGNYGRTWGDYRYTDIGLDPSDWTDPVIHVYYKPSGSLLRISPEENYSFYVNDVNGNIKKLSGSYNWDLVYNVIDGNWYYHSISTANIIDISTLEISIDSGKNGKSI